MVVSLPAAPAVEAGPNARCLPWHPTAEIESARQHPAVAQRLASERRFEKKLMA